MEQTNIPGIAWCPKFDLTNVDLRIHGIGILALKYDQQTLVNRGGGY